MRLLLLLLLFSTPSFSQLSSYPNDELPDPRSWHHPRETIRAGVALPPEDTFPLFVICWFPSPAPEVLSYQISGIPGRHSQARTEAFLKTYYSISNFPPKGPAAPGIIICGNNWIRAALLGPLLTDLSKQLGFTVFEIDPGFVQSVKLLDESPERRRALQKAFDASEPKSAAPAP